MAVIILALFGLALAGIGLISYFRWNKNSGIQAQINQEDKEILVLDARVKQIPELRAKRDNLVKALEDMTRILPNKGDLQHDSFLRLLQTIAENSKVEVRNLSVKAEKETAEKKFARFKYEVEILGTYPQFVDFLHEIETHKQFLKIDSFEMHNKEIGDNGWPETLRKEIKLTISTYTYSAAPE